MTITRPYALVVQAAVGQGAHAGDPVRPKARLARAGQRHASRRSRTPTVAPVTERPVGAMADWLGAPLGPARGRRLPSSLLLAGGVRGPWLDLLPGWLSTIAQGLPVTYGVEAARELVAGFSLAKAAPLLDAELVVGAIYARQKRGGKGAE